MVKQRLGYRTSALPLLELLSLNLPGTSPGYTIHKLKLLG